MSGNLLNAIFVKVVSKNCPLKGKCRRCLESGHMARDCRNPPPPPKSWGTRVSSGGIAVEASGTAGGAAAGVLDPTLLRLWVELFSLSYSLRVPVSLLLGVLSWI